MTIGEAITTLKDMLNRYKGYELPQDNAAQLAIGALERMKLIRKLESEKGKYRFGFLLPSEEEQ